MIKHKSNFVSGIIQVILGIGLLITCIYLKRYNRIILSIITLLCGIGNIIISIETKPK